MAQGFDFTIWNQQLARLINHQASPDAWQQLDTLIAQLCHFDDIAVLLFQQGISPDLIYYRGSRAEQRLVTDIYLDGLYVLDPFYLNAVQNNYGLKTLTDITPKGFYQGDLFELYYQPSGISDEAGFLVPLDAHSFILCSLSRIQPSVNFSDKEKDQLLQIDPLIAAICQQIWSLQDLKSSEPIQPLHNQIIEVLHSFGSSLLTDRESEVIHRILRGYSAQAIADDLEISINTVKLHRKNAYAKLDLSSQNELFHMFLDSLSCVTESTSIDPLISYLSVPERT